MESQTPASVRVTVRAGWNDAAWGQSPRHVNADLVGAYARGYAGGLVYRQRQAPELVGQADSASTRVVKEA